MPWSTRPISKRQCRGARIFKFAAMEIPHRSVELKIVASSRTDAAILGRTTMRLPSAGYAVFAIALIGAGLLGIFSPDLMPLWNPVPGTGSAHVLLLYLGIGISFIAGIGLLVQRVAAMAARLLLAALLTWMLLFRLPNFFRAPPFAACWSVFP